jgi:hydrogenase nickel incorporation protein HypB
MSKIIDIKQAVYSENDAHAAKIHTRLSDLGIFTVNILGGAGAGKTTSLISIIKNLSGIKPYVIEGDIESDIDTQTLRDLGVEAYQINTGGDCHLNAPMMEAILDRMQLKTKGILFVENIGNLVCPAEFVIGEDIKLLICSYPEGSDKPYKYPTAFQKASAIILTKSDLAPYINFDFGFFEKGVRALNPDVPIFRTSGTTGEGFDCVSAWLQNAAGIPGQTSAQKN